MVYPAGFRMWLMLGSNGHGVDAPAIEGTIQEGNDLGCGHHAGREDRETL